MSEGIWSLIGAGATLVVGALVYWAALRASKENLRAMVEADRIERREEREHQRSVVLRSLEAELAWSARTIQEKRTKIGWAWVNLPTDTIQMSRAYWHSLPPDVRHIVEEAARYLARYNALVSYANLTVFP